MRVLEPFNSERSSGLDRDRRAVKERKNVNVEQKRHLSNLWTRTVTFISQHRLQGKTFPSNLTKLWSELNQTKTVCSGLLMYYHEPVFRLCGITSFAHVHQFRLFNRITLEFCGAHMVKGEKIFLIIGPKLTRPEVITM